MSESIDLTNLEAFSEKIVNLYLIPIEQGQTIRLNNIFFDFDKSTLKTESFPELDRLVEVMKKNPAMKIEISGHTDNKGAADYNLVLSRDRAKSVLQYLVKNGIDAVRLSSNGYGKEKPVSTNDTEEGRQLNRRVEFEIL